MFSSDLSDEHVLHLRRKYELSERVLEPLEMSNAEILDFFSEYCVNAGYEGGGGWSVALDGFRCIKGSSFREAVCLAAAHEKESNRDF